MHNFGLFLVWNIRSNLNLVYCLRNCTNTKRWVHSQPYWRNLCINWNKLNLYFNVPLPFTPLLLIVMKFQGIRQRIKCKAIFFLIYLLNSPFFSLFVSPKFFSCNSTDRMIPLVLYELFNKGSATKNLLNSYFRKDVEDSFLWCLHTIAVIGANLSSAEDKEWVWLFNWDFIFDTASTSNQINCRIIF